MRISYNWLKQFINIDALSLEEVSDILTDLGLEVEGISKFESIKGGLKGLVVGYVLSCEKHPNADKLKITSVDIGKDKPLQIVCGAPNIAKGQKVPVATIGTLLYDKEGNSFKIKKGKIRGEESFGMICSEEELGLGTANDGIMVLESTTKVGGCIADIFNVETDDVIEIGLTPNRADAMSHFGVARDLKAGILARKNTTSEIILPSVSNFKIDKRTFKIEVEVADKTLIPRYSGLTISDVTVKPSPSWLQNKLKAIGLVPKNNIVDATNYVLHELGQPLHAFDAASIKGNKIEVKTVGLGTKFTTLDDVERELDAEDIMICNAEEPMCIAGVLGGKNSGVTENTKAIFLESAYFNPVAIRKTAKRHALNTDASFRFERGIDPTITEYALKRAALLIQSVAGGEITSDIIDIYPTKIEDFPIFLNFENAKKIIGEELPRETIKNILVSLDIKITNVTDVGLGLLVPSYRVDVQREVDIIEEILRVYGYNNISFPSKLNAIVAHSSRTEGFKVQYSLSTQLCALGFNEIMANSLTSPKYTQLSTLLKEEWNVAMLNPLSNDLSVMRQSMLFSGLEVVAFNSNRKQSDLKLFEFGKTYHKKPSGYEEEKHLTLLLSGNSNDENWTQPQQKSDFFLGKGYIHFVLERLGINNKTKTIPVENDVFSEGLSFCIGKETIVSFGTIKSSILKHFGIKQEVFYADFNWDSIQKYISNKMIFKAPSKYPKVRRDVALLLDTSVTFEQVYKTAIQTEKKLLKNVSLFDVYEGKNIPKGKKSYAITCTLQDENKTLTDKQIDKIMTKLTANFKSQLNASLR